MNTDTQNYPQIMLFDCDSYSSGVSVVVFGFFVPFVVVFLCVCICMFSTSLNVVCIANEKERQRNSVKHECVGKCKCSIELLVYFFLCMFRFFFLYNDSIHSYALCIRIFFYPSVYSPSIKDKDYKRGILILIRWMLWNLCLICSKWYVMACDVKMKKKVEITRETSPYKKEMRRRGKETKKTIQKHFQLREREMWCIGMICIALVCGAL